MLKYGKALNHLIVGNPLLITVNPEIFSRFNIKCINVKSEIIDPLPKDAVQCRGRLGNPTGTILFCLDGKSSLNQRSIKPLPEKRSPIVSRLIVFLPREISSQNCCYVSMACNRYLSTYKSNNTYRIESSIFTFAFRLNISQKWIIRILNYLGKIQYYLLIR